MYALFDEAGKFLAGRVMSETDSALQVELDTGKRVKVKAANLLMRFARPEPAAFLAEARALADDIDLDLAWEFAPEEAFGFNDLARDYYSADATLQQQAAALMCLQEAPHYFRRAGKGQYRKAPEETVKAALLAIERKARVAEQIEAWAAELAEGRCPEPVREQLYRILFKPDKNAPEYKAVVEASRRSQRAPLELLKAAGAIRNAYEFHWQRFLFEQFAKGPGFPPGLEAPEVAEVLPLAPVQAFSIDDSATTEIDDALSVTGLGTGEVVLGIHIAAPALAIAPDSPVDKVARERMSTVYLPGWKITMLPADVVQAYTLDEGRDCPAVSLYLRIDEHTLAIRSHETKLERVPIAVNLRHDQLDEVVTEASLSGQAVAEYPFAAELTFCHRLAQQLKFQRETVRGKPENFNRPDYSFRIDTATGQAPTGDETVHIGQRKRGAALDLIVSEAMILANSTWGGWLADLGVPGIYRTQAAMAPGIKVRMGTKPLPHAGMGVAQYTWATSPLRRYVDLLNQWQIIACARHGATAALAAPFKPKDATLFSVISSFDAAYGAYNDFQRGMERYWALRWLQQEGVDELIASVMKDGLVRADTLPLVFRVAGSEEYPRGTRLRARITAIDLFTLDLHASMAALTDPDRMRGGGLADADDDDSGGDEGGSSAAAGGLKLAIDVDGDGQPAATEGNAGGHPAAD